MFAAVMVVGAAKSAPTTEALIAETQAALDAGDALHAANLADTGLNDEAASAGERGRLFLYRGLAEELLGFHDQATRDFTAALNTGALLAEERAQALLQRGFLRDGMGHLDDAAKDYTGVIALKGDGLVTALNNRANIYRRQNRFVEARRDYQAALSAGGGKPEYAWYGLGQIAEAQADTVAARGFYAKAVAADPGYALASERLEALGGPPDKAIVGPQDPIVLHPPESVSTAGTAAQGTKVADSRRRVAGVATRWRGRGCPRHSGSGQARGTAIGEPGHPARQGPDVSCVGQPQAGEPRLVLRPALDQAAGGTRNGTSEQDGIEVQLGAWRSEAEANAGWTSSKAACRRRIGWLQPAHRQCGCAGQGPLLPSASRRGWRRKTGGLLCQFERQRRCLLSRKGLISYNRGRLAVRSRHKFLLVRSCKISYVGSPGARFGESCGPEILAGGPPLSCYCGWLFCRQCASPWAEVG